MRSGLILSNVPMIKTVTIQIFLSHSHRFKSCIAHHAFPKTPSSSPLIRWGVRGEFNEIKIILKASSAAELKYAYFIHPPISFKLVLFLPEWRPRGRHKESMDYPDLLLDNVSVYSYISNKYWLP